MTAQDFTPYVFMQRLRDNRGLPSRTKLVAFALVSYAQPGNNIVYPSVQTIADVTGLSIDTVKAALKDLNEAGVAKPLRQRRGSMARTLFYPRHDAWAPRRNSRHRPMSAQGGEPFTHQVGEPFTPEVITKNYLDAEHSAAKRSAALAPSAQRAGSPRRMELEQQPRPVNAHAIADFWIVAPLSWEEWIEGESIPLKRPNGNRPGDEFMRRCWDDERKAWEESEREVAAKIEALSAVCEYGCAARGARFVHTDGTHWYCAHNEPWPEQVEWFRENYPECRPDATAQAKQ